MARRRPMFELAHFAWGAPDRLELAGTFVGLSDFPAEAPTLVISGTNGMHRLPVVPDSLSGPREDGGRWEAVFAWQEAPVAFDVAKLEFGDEIVVELPEPSARRTRARRQTLEVSRERTQEKQRTDGDPERADDPSPQEEIVQANGVQRLRVQAELLATEEALRDARTDLERSQAELTRARDDLASERALRSADAERFRQGLAEMSAAAEQALAAEQSAAHELDAELREARAMIEAKDATLGDLSAMLDAAATTRAQAESEARAEIDALRERVATLEGAGNETDQLRAELEATRTQADLARAELDQIRSTMNEVRSDVERLLSRLGAVRDAAGDGA
jgi:polyhydroxyalkanoate synthesis regulator phasin